MRKRHAAALISALALAAAGGLAYADSFSGTGVDPAPATAKPSIVTLTNGDRVEVPAHGPLVRLDTDHATRTTRLSNGDRVVVPFDQLSRVRSGRVDPRLFDVDALARNGYGDARDVDDPARLGGRFSLDPGSSAKTGTKVTVKATWVDESAPDYTDAIWVNLDTGKSGEMSADGGSAADSLAPGDYGFVATVGKPRSGTEDMVVTTAQLKVTDQAATIKLDGKKAKPLGFAVDSGDAQPSTNDLTAFVGDHSGGEPEMTFIGLDGKAKLYAIPSAKTKGYLAGYSLTTQLATAPGAAKPLSYSLVDTQEHGVTRDPLTTVHDDQLARRTADYRSMGAKSTIDRGDYADLSIMDAMQASIASRVDLPSKRTEFYTASGDAKWGHFGAMDADHAKSLDQAQRYSGAMKPGSGTMSWLSAPLSPAVPTSFDWQGMVRLPHDGESDTPELVLSPALFDSPDPNETMGSWQIAGKATLSKDGKTLATSDDGATVYADLPQGDKGRYTASFDAKRQATWTSLGTESTAKWAFDSTDAAALTPVDVSAVRFDAEGISGGYADASKAQKVTLDFVTAAGAADRECKAMTFQVSYDDGKTWKKVALKRKGDHATATLKHPSGARFVSVKFSTKDDKGQTFTGTTIRSYGLR